MNLLKENFSKKEICHIFNINLKELEKYIKNNNIKHTTKKQNQSYGYTYLYNILNLSSDEIFKTLTNINIDEVLNEFVYQFDIENKNKKEISEIKKLHKEKFAIVKEVIYNNNKPNEELFWREIWLSIQKDENIARKQILENITENSKDNYYKEIFDEKRKKIKYVLHVGDTNSGKTYNAINELKNTSGVYLSPLRLLAWEVFEKLNKDEIICSLLTGEENVIHPNTKILSCTVEMLNYDTFHKTIVLDECLMLNDKDRGKSWFKAITQSNCDTMHLITNKETKNIILKILQTLGRENVTVKEYEKLVPLEVYHKFDINKPPKKSLLIVFSRLSVLKLKSSYESKGYNVSILYGNLPPEVKRSEIERFNSGISDICITTDVVGMGLNLHCDNVIFVENTKFDGISTRYINATEVKQIGGRAGRFGLSKKGLVGGIDTNRIKKSFDVYNEVDTTYLGFDYKIVCNIPKKSMTEQIQLWYDADLIPDLLKNIVKKESVSKYTENVNNYVLQIEEKNKDLAWSLVYSPVKKSNRWYFERVCGCIKYDVPIELPYCKIVDINSNYDLKDVEKYLSELDIYFYITNNKIFKSFKNDDRASKLNKIKYEYIDKINNYLIKNKNKKNKKS